MADHRDSSTLRFSELGNSLSEPLINNLLKEVAAHPNILSLAAGLTDNTFLPRELLEKVVPELNADKRFYDALQYGTAKGREGLRVQICKHLKDEFPGETSASLVPDNVLVSNGSQQALYLAVQSLCDKGDLILVEGPTYFVFLELLRGLGVDARSIPFTEEGRLDFDGIEALINELKQSGQIQKLKALYLIPYYSNPSARSISLEDKQRLAGLLKEQGVIVPILEDAAYRQLHFKQAYEAPSCLSIDAFREFPCVYFGTFSKSLSAGLKCGYAISNHRELLRKMTFIKGHHDFGTSNYGQAIIELIMEKGWYHEYLQIIRPLYAAKAGCLMDALEQGGFANEGWSWVQMEGGMMCWVTGPKDLDTSIGSRFHKMALEKNLLYVPGDLCFAEGDVKNCIRLSIGPLQCDRIHEGVHRIAEAFREIAV